MIRIRTAVVASLAAAAALAVGVPAAGANVPGDFTSSFGPCETITGPDGQAGTAGTNNQICIGAGGAAVGPSIGQIATVVGPRIDGPATIGTSIITAGDAAAGPPL